MIDRTSTDQGPKQVNIVNQPTAAAGTAAEQLHIVIQQMRRVLEGLTDEGYTVLPAGHFESGIGGHVRHSLDHIDALLRGLSLGVVDYDARKRGTAVETDRVSAIAELDRLSGDVQTVRSADIAQPLDVQTVVSPTDKPVRLTSSIGRELAFVLSHTIHHNAMIAALARAIGCDVPQWFGYAPSTIAHIQQDTCAR